MKKDKRFETIYKEGGLLDSQRTILRDKQTGVHYLCVSSGYAHSVTPLLGADGKPVVTATSPNEE